MSTRAISPRTTTPAEEVEAVVVEESQSPLERLAKPLVGGGGCELNKSNGNRGLNARTRGRRWRRYKASSEL